MAPGPLASHSNTDFVTANGVGSVVQRRSMAIDEILAGKIEEVWILCDDIGYCLTVASKDLSAWSVPGQRSCQGPRMLAWLTHLLQHS